MIIMMGKEEKIGLITHIMTVITLKAKGMDMVFLCGKMGRFIKGNSLIIKSMGLGFING
jgi:hypothetical protein